MIARATVVSGIALVVLALAAGPAHAHANLDTSDPAGGATLAEAPSQVTMVFTEPPDPEFLRVEVLNAGGQPVQAGPARLGRAPRSVVVPMPADLPDGVYSVTWQVVSTTDGHLSRNVFAFGVGVEAGSVASPDTAAPSTPAPSPLAVIGRSLLYLGILLAIGTTVAGLWTIGPGLPGRRVLVLSAGGLAVAGALAMLIAERATIGVSIGELLSSSTGRPYLWLLGAAGLTLVCLVTAAFTAGRAGPALLGLAAAVTALVRVKGGHPAEDPWSQQLLQVVHIAAAGVWIGGFAPVLMLLRACRGRETPTPIDAVRRYSRTAGWAVLAVVVTGLLRTVIEAGGAGSVLSMLSDTSYGTALIVKVALVALLIGLGAMNRRRAIPRLAAGDHLLRRVMSVEAATALVVVLTTGLLTGLDPEPPAPPPPPEPAAISATGSDFATTVRVTLIASPGLAGSNNFEAAITDYDSGEPIEATAVGLGFEAVGRPEIPDSQLDLEQADPGMWVGRGAQLSLAGVWNVTVQTQLGGRATQVPLVLTTRPPGSQRSSVSLQEGLPDIVTLTLSGGMQLQCYVDPGSTGTNDVHVTAFGVDGSELALEDLVVVATPDGETPTALDPRRLSAGHFSAPAELEAGSVRFDAVATARDGTVLQATFTQEIADA